MESLTSITLQLLFQKCCHQVSLNWPVKTKAKIRHPVIMNHCHILQYNKNVSSDVSNCYVQRSAPRRNDLKVMNENLTLLKLVEIMRQMIQKIFLKKQKKNNIFRVTLRRRLQCSILYKQLKKLLLWKMMMSKTKSCNSVISEMYLALQQNRNWRSV